MDIINILQEQIRIEFEAPSNQRRSKRRIILLILGLLIMLLNIWCLYKCISSSSKTSGRNYIKLNHETINMDLPSQKELQLNDKDIISILLYEPLNGTWVSNSTIQGNNATQGIAQLIFRQYSFSSLFNYDLVLYDYEGDKIPQGVIISNNESFSAKSNQNNSMNISIDNDTFTVISTQPMCIKSITQNSSQLIMVSTKAKFDMTLNKYSLNGSLKLEIEDVSINLNIQPGEISFYSNNKFFIFSIYFVYLVFTISIVYINKSKILRPYYYPYSFLLNAIFNNSMIIPVFHLMLITKVYFYYLPLFILQIFMGFYWYSKRLANVMKKETVVTFPNGLTYIKRNYDYAFCFILCKSLLY